MGKYDKKVTNQAKDTIKYYENINNLEEIPIDILRIMYKNKINKLNEKDKIIDEQLKENVKLQTELNTENNRCMILANNDKFKEQVIDLMAEHIHINNCYKCPNIKCEDNGGITCEDCIKQYFENKVNSSSIR